MYDLSGWIGTLVGFIIRTLIVVLFLLTLRGLLKQVRPQNRAFKPDLVWLNLIPVFDYAWIFVTLVKVRESVRAEFRARDWAHRPDPSFRVGLTSGILYVGAGLVELIWLFAGDSSGSWFLVSAVASVLSLGFWIVYWMRISRLKRTLEHEAFIPAEERQTRCPSCGLLPIPGDEFCRSCGLPIAIETREAHSTGVGEQAEVSSDTVDTTDAAGMRCPQCGAAYRPNARVCSWCGRVVV